jgi:putative aldouronate transport system substrate-binding protein
MSDVRSDVFAERKSRPSRQPGLSRRGFLSSTFAAGIAATLGGSLAGCSSESGSLRLGKPVVGGPRTTANAAVIYPKDYVGPIASKIGRITSEPADLRVLVMQDAATVGDWFTNKMTKWYEARTGVRVHWQVIAAEDSKTKINAMIAAGDIPDVFMTNPAFTASQVMYYGEQGLFIRLNELIEKYGTETKRVYQQYPQFKKVMEAPDGSHYSLPYVNDCFHCKTISARGWIYKPWLDKLGLEMPQTTAEFEEALDGFKRGNVNGDGKKDVVPFASSVDIPIDPFFMGSFLYSPADPWLTLDDGKVGISIDKPEWREGLRYLHRLGRKGLIAKESFTQLGDQLVRVGDSKKPLLGCSVANIWASFMTMDAVDKKARWRDYLAVPTLAGPEGVRINPWAHYGGIDVGRFTITKACKNPEIALMWGDGLMELEAGLRGYSGVLGEHWRWGKRGETGINGKQGTWYTDPKKPAPINTHWSQMGMMYRSNDHRLCQVADPKNPTFEEPLHKQTEQMLYPHRVDIERVLPPQYLTADQIGEASETAVPLTNHVKQSIAKFTRGELDPNSDSDWNDYLGTVKQMNLKRYLQVQQAAYDSKYG